MAKSLRKKKKPAKRKKSAARKPTKRKTTKKKTTAKRRPTKRKATKRKVTKKKATKRKAPKRKKAAKKKPAKKKKTSKKSTRKKPAKKKARKAPPKRKAPAKKKKAPKKKAAAKKKPKVFVYNMYDLKETNAPTSAEINGHRKLSGKSTTEACNIKGQQMQVGIAHKRQGTGSKLHTHPNEQYNFVLKGVLQVDIDGQRLMCPAGSVVHIPAGVVHGTCASSEGDVIFYVCKDNRHGMAGPPIDGKEDGARYLPGFEPTDDERALDADKTRKVQKQF